MERDPAKADELQILATQLQLGAAALLLCQCSSDAEIDATLSYGDGRDALEMALNMEAKVFLSQVAASESRTSESSMGRGPPGWSIGS